MGELHQLPNQVERILDTLQSLREDLFDPNIGFIRKKISQIIHGQSEDSLSNLNNYLVAVQRIAENCQSYWDHKGMTQDGYDRLRQHLQVLKETMAPLITSHHEHPREIRSVIASVKLRLTQFLQTFITHVEEERRQPKSAKAKKKKPAKIVPPQQRKAPRTPEQRTLRAFDLMDEERRNEGKAV